MSSTARARGAERSIYLTGGAIAGETVIAELAITLRSGLGVVVDTIVEKDLSTRWNIDDCMDGESLDYRIPCEVCIRDAGVVEASCLHENTFSRTSHAEIVRVKASFHRVVWVRLTEREELRHLLLSE